MTRSPADVLGLLRAQLDDDQDPTTDRVLNGVELARVEGAAAMLAAVVNCEPWPQWVDPPRGRRSPRASELAPNILAQLLDAHNRQGTWQGVADELNAAGVTGPRGGRWRAQTVKVVVQASR